MLKFFGDDVGQGSSSVTWLLGTCSSTPGVELLCGYVAQGVSNGFGKHPVQHRVSNFCVAMLLREFQVALGNTTQLSNQLQNYGW